MVTINCIIYYVNFDFGTEKYNYELYKMTLSLFSKENGTISILYAAGRGDSYKPECGHAYQRSSNSSKGIWSVYLSGQVSDYFILSNGTDYDYYSAVYYCKETDVGPIQEDGLILTRYKHPSFSQV